jgi:two-component system, cell cycle response regulator DivK
MEDGLMSPLALITDDHPPSVALVRYLLELAEFEVIGARDGAEALALAAARRPDVIVLDLDIPVLDGCEVADRLALDPDLRRIPILVVSVYEISDFSASHGAADFAGYVRKPLEPTTFAAEVHAVISRPWQGRPNPARI